MFPIRHEADTCTLENQTNHSTFRDYIPDTVHISAIPHHYNATINLRDQHFLLFFLGTVKFERSN